MTARTLGPNNRAPDTRVVVGIDLSLTATGLAAVTSDGMHEASTVKSSGKRGDTLVQRAGRIDEIVFRVNDFACHWRADLVVIEGPSIMSKGGSSWDRAWLWGTVVEDLLSTGVAVCPPTVLKKWAAGKGNADKAAVAVGVSRLWREIECDSDNEWDALALASMGSQRLGFGVVPDRAHHAACLEKVEWPVSLLSADDLTFIDEDSHHERTADAADGENR